LQAELEPLEPELQRLQKLLNRCYLRESVTGGMTGGGGVIFEGLNA
jgi:hypothetical protein